MIFEITGMQIQCKSCKKRQTNGIFLSAPLFLNKKNRLIYDALSKAKAKGILTFKKSGANQVIRV